MKKRIINTLLGFLTGVLTIPLAAIAWPFVLASFLWNESEEDDF